MAGLTITILRIRISVSAAADRPASYGNQIVSSTQPSCYIQMSTVTRWVWSIFIRCLYHWPANEVDSAWDDQPLTYTQKRKNRSLSHPLGHLGVMYALHLWLVGKPVVDFIFVVIELFSLSPTVETLWAEIGRGVFRRGWSLWAQISEGRGHRPPTIIGIRVAEWLPFRAVWKYPQCII